MPSLMVQISNKLVLFVQLKLGQSECITVYMLVVGMLKTEHYQLPNL